MTGVVLLAVVLAVVVPILRDVLREAWRIHRQHPGGLAGIDRAELRHRLAEAVMMGGGM